MPWSREKIKKKFQFGDRREVVSRRLGFLEADAETEFEVQDIN